MAAKHFHEIYEMDIPRWLYLTLKKIRNSHQILKNKFTLKHLYKILKSNERVAKEVAGQNPCNMFYNSPK